MANTDEPVLIDAMIARLEKANASAYEKRALRGEGVLKPNKDAERLSADQQDFPAIPNGQSPRAGKFLIALIALLAACACATAVAWEPSYGEAAKRFAQRANPWVLREGLPAVSPISPDIASRLQSQADRLANMEQQIEALRASQELTIRGNTAAAEQFGKSQQQVVHDNEETAEELKATLAQLDRQNAALARQVKANQEQLAVLASAPRRYGSKRLRRNPGR